MTRGEAQQPLPKSETKKQTSHSRLSHLLLALYDHLLGLDGRGEEKWKSGRQGNHAHAHFT
jgi:hypothetical protein